MSAEDVRKLHSPFKIYDECDCDKDDPDYHDDGREVVYVEDVGFHTCAKPQVVCRECHTDDGMVTEDTEYWYGNYPCATLKALELP